jgi:hypothetical protein
VPTVTVPEVPDGPVAPTPSATPAPPAPVVHAWARASPLLIIPVLGSILSLISTRHGALVGQDAAAYMGAASNLLHGRGLTTPFVVNGSALSPQQMYAFHGAVPLTHFPPGYSIVLAGVSSVGPSIAAAARALNVVTLGGILLVFELLVRRCTRSPLLLPIAAACLLLAGPATFFHEDLLEIQTGVASDPLFLFVFLLAVWLLDAFLAHATRRLYVALVICVTVAPLIRYVGLSLVVGVAVVVLLWAPLSGRQRRRSALVLLACGLLPSAAWAVVTQRVLHGDAARSLAWHPWPQPLQGLLTLGAGWLFPSSWPLDLRWCLLIGVALMVGLALVKLHRAKTADGARTIRQLMSMIVIGAAFLAVVLCTRAFLDASTPIDNRILLPLIPLTYIVAITALVSLTGRAVPGLVLTAALCLLAAAPAVGPSLALVRHGAPSPQAGLAASPTMAAIRALPPGTLIASGIGDLVYSQTGRSSIGIPVRVNGLTDRKNGQFKTQLRQLADILADHHGVLVVPRATSADFIVTGATPADLATVARLRLIRRLSDGGTIYRVTRLPDPS